MVSKQTKSEEPNAWTFLSNHAHVLLSLAKSPSLTVREIADEVGITERAVHRILRDLEEGRYITITKHGRRNSYQINSGKHFRHPIASHQSIQSLLTLVKK
jgi:DNA-binding MarR family transcriptional regulator